MKADDANFELSVSNSIERLTLYHRRSIYRRKFNNTVGKTVGIIFINSRTLDLPFQRKTIGQREKRAHERMKYMWGVTDPITIAEPTKERVIEEFKKLMKIAEEF